MSKNINLRKYSLNICGVFDELLESSGIQIPDDDRTNSPEEANIYGTTYFKLEEDVTKILLELAKEVRKNPDKGFETFHV